MEYNHLLLPFFLLLLAPTFTANYSLLNSSYHPIAVTNKPFTTNSFLLNSSHHRIAATNKTFTTNSFLLNSSHPTAATENQPASFSLALQWPAGYCTSPNGGNCQVYPHNSFTIHGLFAMNQTGYPYTCTGPPPMPYDSRTIWDIRPTLEKYWPNLNGDNDRFWSYQWWKHGSCLGISPRIFFLTVLDLRRAVDLNLQATYWLQNGVDPVFATLNLAGIYPGRFYNLVYFQRTFQTAVGLNEVTCTKFSSSSRHNQLLELSFCFNLNLKLIPCNHARKFVGCTPYIWFR